VGRIVLIERKRTMLICSLQKLWKEVDVICKTSCIFHIIYICAESYVTVIARNSTGTNNAKMLIIALFWMAEFKSKERMKASSCFPPTKRIRV
jgi:hypothetical protein